MLRKTMGGASKSLQKLPSAPGLSEIHHFLSMAMEHRGRLVEISWLTPDRTTEFSLNIQCPIRGGDTEWKLFSVQQGNLAPELIWDYRSCDVLLVYNLMVSSCGEINMSVKADGAIQVSESYRDASRHRDTYYMHAIQTNEMDRAKLASLGLQDNSWSKGQAALSGDLSLVQISNLFQSILIARMTGLLEVDREYTHARIYFADGEPEYAEIGDLTGDECILEMLTWKDGKYRFEPRARTTEEKNVSKRLEDLVITGVQLMDKVTYLKNAGLFPESVLIRKHPKLTPAEFDARVHYGAPAELSTMRAFYGNINDKISVSDVAANAKMGRSIWAPILCHLLTCDLVLISNEQVGQRGDRPALEPKVIDKTAIHSVMMALRRPETGMYTYPAFLYFMEQEYFRGYRSGSPLSVMVMELRVQHGPPDYRREPLPVAAIAEVVRRISQLKRHIDMLAHYEGFDFAMLLPNTKNQGALIFANRIVKALVSAPLPGNIDREKISIAIGASCIPEDFLDLSYLLTAAEVAKAQAVHTANSVMLFRDLK